MDEPADTPERIFLQWWQTEVSWCKDRIDSMVGEDDVEYVRLDKYDGLRAERDALHDYIEEMRIQEGARAESAEALVAELDNLRHQRDSAVLKASREQGKASKAEARVAELGALLIRARDWIPLVGDGAVQPAEIDELCDAIDAAMKVGE